MKPLVTPPSSFQGILIFKVLLVLGCLALIVSAVSGIASISTTAHGTVITHHTLASRLFAVLMAVVFAVFCYGLHRRWLAVWRVGFVLLVLACLNFIRGIWLSSRAEPSLPPFVLPLFVGLGGAAVTMYWWVWWYRQKAYFVPPPPIT